MPNAKLGAKVDRYSFLVRILHSLLHTGLARRTNIALTLIGRARGPQHGSGPQTGFGEMNSDLPEADLN